MARSKKSGEEARKLTKASVTATETKDPKSVLIPEDDDTRNWDGTDIEELCRKGREEFITMFRASYFAIKILTYIEYKSRWREIEKYKTSNFRFFLKDMFDIGLGTFSNMKAVARKYNQMNFDRWGERVLKRIEGTSDPMRVLSQLNEIHDSQGYPGGVRVQNIIDEYKVEPQEQVTIFEPKWATIKRLQDRIADMECAIGTKDNEIVALTITNEQLREEIKRLQTERHVKS